MKEHDRKAADRGGEPDHGDEEKRAAVYGLGVKDLLDTPLIIPEGKHVRLEPEKGAGKSGFRKLEPRDLDDVKRWIGVPDELGARRCGCRHLPSAVPSVTSGSDIRKLDTNTQRALHEIAHEYVHGDSRRLLPYKATLAHLLDRAYITGLFFRQDIDIYNGAVLEIGKSVKVLFARHIRIWRGGQLRVSGDARIDCVSITGDVTLGDLAVFDKFAFDRLAIGRLLN